MFRFRTKNMYHHFEGAGFFKSEIDLNINSKIHSKYYSRYIQRYIQRYIHFKGSMLSLLVSKTQCTPNIQRIVCLLIFKDVKILNLLHKRNSFKSVCIPHFVTKRGNCHRDFTWKFMNSQRNKKVIIT